jgi:hypothetical protein
MSDTHLHFHIDGDKLLASILESFFNIHKKIEHIMADLKAIQDQNAALIAAVAAEDTQIGSAIVLIKGQNQKLADLQTELAAAIAGNDPVAIQAVSDSMAATVSDVNAQAKALADAVVAGTPAAPSATPPTT